MSGWHEGPVDGPWFEGCGRLMTREEAFARSAEYDREVTAKFHAAAAKRGLYKFDDNKSLAESFATSCDCPASGIAYAGPCIRCVLASLTRFPPARERPSRPTS